MICSVKQSAAAFTVSDLVRQKSPARKLQLSSLRSMETAKAHNSILSSRKPLYISSIESFGSFERTTSRKLAFECKAYEADRSQPIDADIELLDQQARSAAAQKLKISIYFATWWALNVVFNIYNKKVLNAFPYPWLTSTLSLATGSLMMLGSWATRIAEAPKTDMEFWKTLFPVAVSFTHIIKSGEPAFSVLVSRFLLGETFPVPVYLSLLPIIGGCGLAAVTEINFNMTERDEGEVCWWNELLCLSLSMLSLLILTPFAIAVEGPQMWAAGWEKAISQIGPHFIWWVVAQSVFYHLYNQVSYMSLNEISPLTFSIGNTMKRISVIVSSIIIFGTPVQPVNALGASIAILGTFLYSQAKQ
ncbi:hypothetical protein HHK36_005608 [Tetracentron sinense]|uniref:Sugar phosphate transporter domain-containing protein n=1 Tax=Tetracentron sinense TaxID=13715 RepID=A0A835DN00_TETSI|nr:hypothetical protein HHK36_005608 [Tetracentron sinense]